jgi:hypothetical protein
MNYRMEITSSVVIALLAVGMGGSGIAQQAVMTFFVASVGSGKGGDLGGLNGADQHCQQLAQAAGSGSHTWHAYLSTQAVNGQQAVNAGDRIGKGPWTNAKGVIVAKDPAELHGQNNLTKQTALSEKGEVINGRGDTPNRHDVLTPGTLRQSTAKARPSPRKFCQGTSLKEKTFRIDVTPGSLRFVIVTTCSSTVEAA